jgi:hypothetical protein
VHRILHQGVFRAYPILNAGAVSHRDCNIQASETLDSLIYRIPHVLNISSFLRSRRLRMAMQCADLRLEDFLIEHGQPVIWMSGSSRLRFEPTL